MVTPSQSTGETPGDGLMIYYRNTETIGNPFAVSFMTTI